MSLFITKPEVGLYLFSSCAGEDYGQIVGVGKDENQTPTIDIELTCVGDIAWTEEEDSDFPHPDLQEVDLPKGTKVILRKVQYRMLDPWSDGTQLINCRRPGNGCYRCTKMFALHRQPTKWNS